MELGGSGELARRVGRYFGGAYVIEFGGASELAV